MSFWLMIRTRDLLSISYTTYVALLCNSGGCEQIFVQHTAAKKEMDPFAGALYGAGTDLIKTELGAYRTKLLGSGNGHWVRATEKLGGELSYKPPIDDINAPDLYIPLMAFGTYVLVFHRFSPEALGVQAKNGMLCWLIQVLLLETTVHTLGDGGVRLLDIVAYGGYTFAVSMTLIWRIVWSYSVYVVAVWKCLCMGMLLVKNLQASVIIFFFY
ncbi:hypothetical protein V6N12_042256 [Hibiscus sabdariffa]|uniref:EXPERA domain-containing protein n=1 Tax=Hibiscus sabdariffa TaxID=183260 RepID=A0ABR2EE86_9ROSI